MGAHVCGIAGSNFNDTKIGRISGLDPAGPGFTLPAVYPGLNQTNAELVTVEHTNAGGMNFTSLYKWINKKYFIVKFSLKSK